MRANWILEKVQCEGLTTLDIAAILGGLGRDVLGGS